MLVDESIETRLGKDLGKVQDRHANERSRGARHDCGALRHFDMTYAGDDDGWTEVTRGRRTVRGGQQVENRAVHDEWTTALRS